MGYDCKCCRLGLASREGLPLSLSLLMEIVVAMLDVLWYGSAELFMDTAQGKKQIGR